ncbi:hypothetical protein [Arthrobacter sp. CAL618]|uniref:hypothetical protein n=1 Tax=Arthrobacter sp. CAL618 TaxID=1055770 RepID=UPI000402D9D9|nr:hypothetical protein [Arthrobacter sp. CAL618]
MSHLRLGAATGETPAEPITSTGGVLFRAHDIFSSVELQAMRIDGLLRRVCGNSYARADHHLDPASRAQSAILCVPASLRAKVALARQSAAWVYGCAPLPETVNLVTDHRRRTTALPPFSEALMHQVALGPCDVRVVGGVGVTAPLRTALDVAVHGHDDWAVPTLVRLAAHPDLRCDLVLVVRALEATRRVPGKNRALARLQSAMHSG